MKVHVDAAIAEDLDGGFRQLVGDENFGGHDGSLMRSGSGSGRAGPRRVLEGREGVGQDRPRDCWVRRPGLRRDLG
jgi:hypothetical protein